MVRLPIHRCVVSKHRVFSPRACRERRAACRRALSEQRFTTPYAHVVWLTRTPEPIEFRMDKRFEISRCSTFLATRMEMRGSDVGAVVPAIRRQPELVDSFTYTQTLPAAAHPSTRTHNLSDPRRCSGDCLEARRLSEHSLPSEIQCRAAWRRHSDLQDQTGHGICFLCFAGVVSRWIAGTANEEMTR